jgi:hypothetical protein
VREPSTEELRQAIAGHGRPAGLLAAVVPLRAMAPALELRCPHCAEVLGLCRRLRVTVGRPFEECPKCRAFVGRPSTNEWDLLGPGGKILWFAELLAPFLALGLVPALAYWALAFRDGSGDQRILVALLCASPAVILMLPLAHALRAIRRSRARMADPMYRARLIEFGRRTTSAGPS